MSSLPSSISVSILFFGAARGIAGASQLDFQLPAPATVATLKREILAKYPALERFGRSLLVARNCEYAGDDTTLEMNDEIAFFPPVSGGATNDEDDASSDATSSDFYELTTDAIDITNVARRVVPSVCGATVTLDGYVREHTRNHKRTLYLVYEAYEPMARRELRRIGSEARAKFDIAHVGIVHRTGRLEIGETSVCIAVAAPHRRAAFEACEWLIKELKRTVPIWKKEFYEDGSVWVEGEHAEADTTIIPR